MLPVLLTDGKAPASAWQKRWFQAIYNEIELGNTH